MSPLDSVPGTEQRDYHSTPRQPVPRSCWSSDVQRPVRLNFGDVPRLATTLPSDTSRLSFGRGPPTEATPLRGPFDPTPPVRPIALTTTLPLPEGPTPQTPGPSSTTDSDTRSFLVWYLPVDPTPVSGLHKAHTHPGRSLKFFVFGKMSRRRSSSVGPDTKCNKRVERKRSFPRKFPGNAGPVHPDDLPESSPHLHPV